MDNINKIAKNKLIILKMQQSFVQFIKKYSCNLSDLVFEFFPKPLGCYGDGNIYYK